MPRRPTPSTHSPFGAFVAESRRQYDILRKCVLNGGIRKALRRVQDYAENLPFVLLKTPEEWEQELISKAEKEGKVRLVPSPYWDDVAQLEFIRPPVEPGMIRVKAYKTISDVYFDSILWDDLSISANGELSIYPMRRYWDLQKIAAVDSVHVTSFWPSKTECISPLALRVLMDNQDCLRIVERTTPGRRFARKLRLFLRMMPYRSLMLASSTFYIGVGVAFALCVVAFHIIVAFMMFFIAPPAFVRGFLTSPIGFLSTCVAVSCLLAWLMSLLPEEPIRYVIRI